MLHVLKIGAPANVHLKLVSHSNRSDVDLNKINVSWALYSAKCDTNKPDGYIIEISSSRSFPENETGIEYYKKIIFGYQSKFAILQVDKNIQNIVYLARVRSFINTTLAVSVWAPATLPYRVSLDCNEDSYLYVDSIETEQWKCVPCMKGASCQQNTASYVSIYGAVNNHLHFRLTGIKAKFGYWRASKNMTNFQPPM